MNRKTVISLFETENIASCLNSFFIQAIISNMYTNN